MPAHVWELRDKKANFKARTCRRTNLWGALLSRAFLQWRHGCDYGVECLLRKQGVLYQLAAFAVKFVTTQIRRDIATAKNLFLSRVATEGHQGAAKILQRVKQAGLGAKQTKPRSRPLPALCHPDTGAPVVGQKQHDRVWTLHFSRQEQGRILDTTDFLAATSARREPDEVQWHWDMLPCYQDLEKIVYTGSFPCLDARLPALTAFQPSFYALIPVGRLRFCCRYASSLC